MNLIEFLFSPKGRIRRRDYWIYGLATTGIALAAEFLFYQAFRERGDTFRAMVGRAQQNHLSPFGLSMLTLQLIMFWPGLCVQIKRWHDRNRPAWLSVAYVALLYAYLYGQPYLQAQNGASVMTWLFYAGMTLYYAVMLWVFVECGCLDGTKGPNRYGPSPKGISTQADIF